jgi:hypothetical protein
MSQAPIQGVRVENFVYTNWVGTLRQRIHRRYPAAHITNQNASVVVIHLNSSLPWTEEDEQFFANLREEGLFQRWETMTSLPPKPRANKTTYEDIGYRIGSGTHLTLKQQEMLLSHLHDLEARTLHAEHEAQSYRDRAEDLEERIGTTIKRHNTMAGILTKMDQVLHIKVHGDIDGLCLVEDGDTGKILLRDVPLSDVYPLIIKLRMKKNQHD